MAINTTHTTDPVIAARERLDAVIKSLEVQKAEAYRTYTQDIRKAVETDPDETLVSALAKVKLGRASFYELERRYKDTAPTDAQILHGDQ